MKRFNSIFALIFCLLILTSCSNSEAPTADETTTLPQTEAYSAEYDETYSQTAAQTSAALTSSSAESQTTYTTTQTTVSQTFTSATFTADTNTEPSSNTAATKAETTQKETEKSSDYCSVTIDCSTIKNNMESLKKGFESFVPQSGYILKDAKVEVKSGETAFDVIKKACGQNVCTDNCKYCQKGKIQLEYTYTPAYKSYYVEGIHQIYEKCCGSMSGWLFSVNGNFPDCSASSYTVKSGDKISFVFTCDGGDDVGNKF